MSDQAKASSAGPAPWRRCLAGVLDFVTVFLAGVYTIGSWVDGTTEDGLRLAGWLALAHFALIVLYFYLGWYVLGGTIWQRIFGFNTSPAAKPAFWRRGLAGLFDFLTVSLVVLFPFGVLTIKAAEPGSDSSFDYAFDILTKPTKYRVFFDIDISSGWSFFAVFALIVLYFYLGWDVLGGTIWQRVFGVHYAAKPAFWRRCLAGLFDLLTVFVGGGYAIALMAGEITGKVADLSNQSALVLFALIMLYFYLGWEVLGGTIWQRIFGAKPSV